MTEAVKDAVTKEEKKVEARVETWADFEIIVKEKDVVVIADMPGVTKDGLDITLHKNILEARGKRSDYDGRRKKDYICSFTLGQEVKRDGIKARIDNGVLTVTVPKAKDTGLVHIPVKS